MNQNYLYHFGVPGMKWGVRKAPETTNARKVASKKNSMDSTKVRLAAMKAKKKISGKDWDRSYNQMTSATRMWTKSGDAILDTANSNARRSEGANKQYKQAKKDYKVAKKEYKKEISKENEDYAKSKSSKKTLDLIVSGEAGKRQINRLMNENKNLTVSQARQTTYVEAGVNTVAFLMLAYGASKLAR